MIQNEHWFTFGCPLHQQLMDAPFAFYFTGSRWMGGYGEGSDWDFIVQDTPEIREWLAAQGFRTIWSPPPEIQDGCTNDVWEYALQRPAVQVQLCPDAARKHRAAERIKYLYHAEHLRYSNAERSALWKLVYESV